MMFPEVTVGCDLWAHRREAGKSEGEREEVELRLTRAQWRQKSQRIARQPSQCSRLAWSGRRCSPESAVPTFKSTRDSSVNARPAPARPSSPAAPPLPQRCRGPTHGPRTTDAVVGPGRGGDSCMFLPYGSTEPYIVRRSSSRRRRFRPDLAPTSSNILR